MEGTPGDEELSQTPFWSEGLCIWKILIELNERHLDIFIGVVYYDKKDGEKHGKFGYKIRNMASEVERQIYWRATRSYRSTYRE